MTGASPVSPSLALGRIAAGVVGGGVGLAVISVLAFSGFNRSAPSPAPLFIPLEIEPRPPLPRDRRSAPRADVIAHADVARSAPPGSADAKTTPAAAEGVSISASRMDSVGAEDASDRHRAMADVLRAALANCVSTSPRDRDACEARRERRAGAYGLVEGTGDAGRDAAFARQGARRMEAWEKQRAEPPRGDPPCETPHPMAGCDGVNIQVDLFSSRDGFLPNLRKRRQ